MKNGRLGGDYTRLYNEIVSRPAQYAHGILMPVTSAKPWNSKLPHDPDGKDFPWAVVANRLNTTGDLLFDRNVRFSGLSSEMGIKIFQFSAAKIKSYQELLSLWQKEKEAWEKGRRDWLETHAGYVSVKEIFDKFESENGKIRGKKRWAIFDEFIAANPGIETYKNDHLYWNRTYRHFKRRPTYTAPGEKHPEWFQFKKNVTYKEIDLNAQKVKLQVITADGTEGVKFAWHEFEFLPDPRMKALGGNATVKGIKMIIRDGSPYLNFAVEISCPPRAEGMPAQAHVDKYSAGWFRNKLKEVVPDDKLVTVAIDLGIRNIAVATVMNGGAQKGARFIKLHFGNDNQPVTLPHIAAHVRERSAKLSESGGRVRRGHTFSKYLQEHITAMKLDRAKKSANRIVAFALQNNAHIIIFEKLQGFIPSDQKEKAINRKLMEWNRRKIVEWAKNIAEPYGILVCEVDPRMTSRICNKCGMIGGRYNVCGGKDIAENGGRLFRCSCCGYKANADFNASVNLHRVFMGSFVAPRKVKGAKAVYEFPDGLRVDLDKLDDIQLGISGDDVFSA